MIRDLISMYLDCHTISPPHANTIYPLVDRLVTRSPTLSESLNTWRSNELPPNLMPLPGEPCICFSKYAFNLHAARLGCLHGHDSTPTANGTLGLMCIARYSVPFIIHDKETFALSLNALMSNIPCPLLACPWHCWTMGFS